MEKSLFFSILISTRNRPIPLESCLNSLRESQILGRKNCETIVIDNASDNKLVFNICREFNVVYIKEDRIGKSIGLNTGINVSRGEYLIFIDDDVVITDPEWPEKLLRNFDVSEDVAYVSGNVKALSLRTEAEISFEKRGGLSKGNIFKVIHPTDFRRPRLTGFPVRLIAAGANCCIPRKRIAEIGGYDELLGPGSLVGGGESLDICYRILYSGYTAIYDPQAIIFHSHPKSLSTLYKKQFQYGVADGAIHTKFWIEFGDWRSFLEIIYGRIILLSYRIILSIIRRYPLPPIAILYGLAGNLIGPVKYFYARIYASITNIDLKRA